MIPQGFLQGDIDLKALEAANPGIKRPNVTFRLVNENVCRAYEEASFPQRVEKSTLAKVNPDSVYPGELKMSGIQISTDTTSQRKISSGATTLKYSASTSGRAVL